jgi:predicted ABC-type ATPase
MITVIAGVNGAGKSSIAGASIRCAGGDYFNPDEVARRLMAADAKLSQIDANAQAWKTGYDQLTRAIDDGQDYTFETTLGGNSVCQLLHRAIDQGQEVRIFFCGLASPELHITRVAERVAKGGHDIPEAKIRERWIHAIHNMMGLIPRCTAVRVFDNSIPADTDGPHPVCLFALQGDHFDSRPVKPMPDWAKPLAGAAIKRVLGDDD